ncbi:MAG: hypothetical protein PHW77_04310 [Eubacteriales bacterium]|nr:hypothetical protein [Eubacteriales bacterium]
MSSTLETLMMVAFGVSWPFSLIKSVKARSTKGKSLLFLLLIDFGYTCGIVWKLVEWKESGAFTYPVVVYIINLSMVVADTLLYFRNKRIEKCTLETVSRS